ncbi:MAG: hypothetical protein K2J20_02855, partial [Bacilli bacterium]|nr:hypothetical protein [Bacilli bacterium]
NLNDELSEYNNKIYEMLKSEGIVDFCCLADYNDGSTLANILQRHTAICGESFSSNYGDIKR